MTDPHSSFTPPSHLPQPHDQEQRNRFRDMWLSQAATKIDFDLNDSTNCIGPFRISEVADCLFGNSPFLSKALIKHPNCVERMATRGPEQSWKALVEELERDANNADTNIVKLMQCLRHHKEAAALHIAICDITTLWTLDEVMGHLSDFADMCVNLTLTSLLVAESQTGNIEVPDYNYPTYDCGIFVLALGKLGSKELNYSSDIDLMILFDGDSLPYERRHTGLHKRSLWVPGRYARFRKN